MSLQPEEPTVEDPEAARVADYLLAHPDFLDTRPDVLARLQLPHASGGAVSLVERQLRILREQTNRYRHQLEELVSVARDNDTLNRRLHGLILALIDAREFNEVVDVLQDELREQFRADAVELKLFSADTIDGHAAEPGPALFRDFMDKGRPSWRRPSGSARWWAWTR